MIRKTATRRARQLGLLCASTILGAGHVVPAMAQELPPYQSLDSNGVDVSTGTFSAEIPEGSIGDANGGVTLSRTWLGPEFGWANNWSLGLYRGDNGVVVTLGATQRVYSGPVDPSFPQQFVPQIEDGSKLTRESMDKYVYTSSDGTKVEYDAGGTFPLTSSACPQKFNFSGCAVPTSIRKPNGFIYNIVWDKHLYCTSGSLSACGSGYYYARLGSVTSSANYKVQLNYSVASTVAYSPPVTGWYEPTGATFSNLANLSAPSPTVGYSHPSLGVTEVTDTGGRTWRITEGDGYLRIRRPGASADTTIVNYNESGTTSVTRDGATTTYSASTVEGTSMGMMTITDAQSHVTTVTSYPDIGRPASVTDPLGKTTSFTYGAWARPEQVISPEGNYTEYSYDDRGNVTSVRMRDKTGTAANDLVATASFDATCANPVTCNQPNSITDARGNTTDYTYDPVHGGVLTVTAPAPSGSGARPQTRYSYTATTAVSGEPVYLLTGTSTCRAGVAPACVGTADETRSTTSYNSTNLLPVTQTTSDGTGTLSATQTLSYDSVGNLQTVDGPLAGSADTTTYRYDSGRRLVGTISPDPDGTGALKRRAERIVYDSAGRVASADVGVVNGTSDSDWTGFATLQSVQPSYDANSRVTRQEVKAGGTTYELTQFSYDAVGRLECEAQRMNSATWSSLPASACSQGTAGAFGADRITKTSYDAAGRPSLVQTGYGVTGVQADEVATTYSDNGRVASVTDAEGNKTTYEYDGHDRLSKTRYPSPTKGAGTSSATDYEQLLYDANGNVTSRRLRGYSADTSQHIDMIYDALNRVTLKNLPGTELDVSYTYDLVGHLTGASQTGNALAFGFDALGRNTSQGGPLGTTSYQYDAAGNRTRMTWPDAFYVDYDYLANGALSHIRENGATSGIGVLATYAYDDFGRRTSLTYGNGVVTTYAIDNLSRLSAISHNLAGSTHDVTTGFSYNPASQITSQTRSNDLYAFGNYGNSNLGYTPNGLNQYASVGGNSYGYDAKGNLTADGINTYTYDSENRLTAVSTGTKLSYDPLGRLYDTYGTTTGTKRFLYDGDQLIAEYSSVGVMLARYVQGTGSDDPLIWYPGAGTSVRRSLQSDQQGSVVSIANADGSAYQLNKYDEHGVPGTNLGRFQYTGQAWIPELGMYYYKARIYSPMLGRFLQSDPIGYGDGMNIYAYVGGDPVNSIDPTGTEDATIYVNGDVNGYKDQILEPPQIFSDRIGGSGRSAGSSVEDSATIVVTGVKKALAPPRRSSLAFGQTRIPEGLRDVTAEWKKLSAPVVAACAGSGWSSKACKTATDKFGREYRWLCRNTGGCFWHSKRLYTYGPERVADENTRPMCVGGYTLVGGAPGLISPLAGLITGAAAAAAGEKNCPQKGERY